MTVKERNKTKRFWIGLFVLVCFNWITGCDIDIVSDTVYIPTPIYYDPGYSYDVIYYYKAKN